MRRMRWWTLLSLGGAGIGAMMLGQAVRGQPDVPGPLPAPPFMAPRPTPTGSGGIMPTMPTGQPLIPPVHMTPMMPSSRRGDLLLTGGALIRQAITAKAPANLPPPNLRSNQTQPSISIQWVGPANVRINQLMTCQIVVHNTSRAALQNVVVRHRLNPGVVCRKSEPNAAEDAGELTWNLGTLAPHQKQRIELRLVAQTRGPLDCQATATFTAVAEHHVQVREPQLTVKMRIPKNVIQGENVTLVFTATNPGDGVAEAVAAKVTLPDGLEHPYGKVIDFNLGAIAPKETKSMQLACTAKGGGVQKCTIVSKGEGGLTSNDSGEFEVLVPKVEVVIAGPKLRYLDRHATYVLKVTNPGSAAATKVEVNEQIPLGFKVHQASHGGKYQASTRHVSWTLDDLQPGQSREFTVDVIPVETGEQRFLAQVKAAHGLRAESETRTLVEGLPALLMEVSHIDDPIEVGAETAYEIRVANTGTKTETNVEVICALPEQLEFRGAKCSTPVPVRHEGREVIFEPLPRLAPKADVIYRVQVKGIAPGDVRFRTRIRADGSKLPIIREESMRIYRDDAPVQGASADLPSLPAAPPAAGKLPPAGPLPRQPMPPREDGLPSIPTLPAPPAVPAPGLRN